MICFSYVSRTPVTDISRMTTPAVTPAARWHQNRILRKVFIVMRTFEGWLGVGYSLLLIEHTHTISFCFGPCHEPHKNATNRTQDMLNHRNAFPPTGTPYGSVS